MLPCRRSDRRAAVRAPAVVLIADLIGQWRRRPAGQGRDAGQWLPAPPPEAHARPMFAVTEAEATSIRAASSLESRTTLRLASAPGSSPAGRLDGEPGAAEALSHQGSTERRRRPTFPCPTMTAPDPDQTFLARHALRVGLRHNPRRAMRFRTATCRKNCCLGWAGLPTRAAPAGTSDITPACAPILAPCPMQMCPAMAACPPT